MKERLTYLYCRGQAGITAFREALAGEAGLSKIATTVILVAVAVALVIAVVGVLGPAIMRLANQTGSQIESVPLDFQ